MSPNKATAKSEEKANFPDPPQGTSEGESILLSWRKLVDDFKSTAGSAKKPEGTTLLPHFFKRREEVNDNVDEQKDKIRALIKNTMYGECILAMEIHGNLRNICAIDYLNSLAGQEVTDNALLWREKELSKDERCHIHDLIKEAEKTATKCKTEGKILDYEKWLHQQSNYFGHAAFALECLRDDLVKTHWKAETDDEKEIRPLFCTRSL